MCRISSIVISFLFSSCAATNTWYIVRHAEKESGTTMTASTIKTSDVPLSEQGMKRAEELKNQLQSKKIKYIYSTNTIRAKSTAEPLSKAIAVPVQIYNSVDSGFVHTLKNAEGNVLVVGHSNTVDDIINSLLGKKILNDLPDAQYGDLFIVHRRGLRVTYEARKF
jgi:2,3-bisphosphoglycerate-dependent phosphoglycerate mutase